MYNYILASLTYVIVFEMVTFIDLSDLTNFHSTALERMS